ncbi:MAG: hypothetical protein K2H52_00015 [Lachnospiraceae bacterium]|nr:hypothetical protein [Lachnospiraceae bacterium]
MKTEHRQSTLTTPCTCALRIRGRVARSRGGNCGSSGKDVFPAGFLRKSTVRIERAGTGLKICGAEHMGDLKQLADSGLNGYSYCYSDPVNYNDSTGETPSNVIGGR